MILEFQLLWWRLCEQKLNGQLTGDSDTCVRASEEIERLRARAEGKGMISKNE